MNIFILLFLSAGSLAIAVIYFWSIINSETVPGYVFEHENGIWSWSYQTENIINLLFLWLIIYSFRKVLLDFFLKKDFKTFIIHRKNSDHDSGNHGGDEGYFISDGNYSYEISEKSYKKLNKGDKVRIHFTKEQRNVRRIELLS